MQTKTILLEIVMFLGLCVQISWVKQDNKGWGKDKRLSTVWTFSAVGHFKKIAPIMMLTDNNAYILHFAPTFLADKQERTQCFLGKIYSFLVHRVNLINPVIKKDKQMIEAGMFSWRNTEQEGKGFFFQRSNQAPSKPLKVIQGWTWVSFDF